MLDDILPSEWITKANTDHCSFDVLAFKPLYCSLLFTYHARLSASLSHITNSFYTTTITLNSEITGTVPIKWILMRTSKLTWKSICWSPQSPLCDKTWPIAKNLVNQKFGFPLKVFFLIPRKYSRGQCL